MVEAGGKVLDSVKALILPELAVIKQDLAVIASRLDGIDRRFDDLRQDLNQRLKELRGDLDRRISDFREDVNQRWGEFRLDLQQSFEKNRQENQGRLDLITAQIAELLTKVARIEADYEQGQEKKAYQDLIWREHQRIIDEMRLKYDDTNARLELLEQEIVKKPRRVSAKKSVA